MCGASGTWGEVTPQPPVTPTCWHAPSPPGQGLGWETEVSSTLSSPHTCPLITSPTNNFSSFQAEHVQLSFRGLCNGWHVSKCLSPLMSHEEDTVGSEGKACLRRQSRCRCFRADVTRGLAGSRLHLGRQPQRPVHGPSSGREPETALWPCGPLRLRHRTQQTRVSLEAEAQVQVSAWLSLVRALSCLQMATFRWSPHGEREPW